MVSSTDARFAKGDAVLAVGHELGVKHHGGYAEYARIPADWAVKLPRGMTLWEAMAFGTAGYTAGLAIVKMEHNGLHPAGGPVIVDGATGGVGSIAIAALAKLGYHVVALTGKEDEADWLKKLGAKEVKLRKEIDLTQDQAARQGDVAGCGGQPGRGGPGLDGEHHEIQRRDRLDRPGGRLRPEHHRDAVHPARRQPARHQLHRRARARSSSARSGRRLATRHEAGAA